MFKVLNKGFSQLVHAPRYGSQDIGISTGGAMDRFSLSIGNILLGQSENAPAYEFMLLPPVLQAECNGLIVLTGAPRNIHYEKWSLPATPYQVFPVEKGDILKFSNQEYGLRSYLCFRPEEYPLPTQYRKRTQTFDEIATWKNPTNKIRVTRGPEYDCMENSNDFISQMWKTTSDMSRMGIRLSGETIKTDGREMISEAVSDGTIQLTKNGPIILMRDRQTVGGYPRIYNVIDVDLDLLSQYAPNQIIRFEEVSIKTALKLRKQKDKCINKLKKEYPQWT